MKFENDKGLEQAIFDTFGLSGFRFKAQNSVFDTLTTQFE